MSNRVRICVVIPGDKSGGAHIGNRAIAALRSYYEGAVGAGEVVWEGNGLAATPVFKTKPIPAAPKLPMHKLAKWYYDHLPAGHQKALTMVVTREPRYFDFKKSLTNPRMQFGLVNPRGGKKVSWKALATGYHYEPSEGSFTELLAQNTAHLASPDEVLERVKRRYKTPTKPRVKVVEAPAEPKPTLRLGIWS